jgi:hypothetical protein
MTHPMLALSLGFGGVILATQIAFAAPQCGPRDSVTALLAERYGETRRAVGIAGETAVMELFAANDSGTWTITMTLPDGQMCLMASGSGYEPVTEELPARGSRI